MIPRVPENRFGEEHTSTDAYHYAKILKAAEGLYTITYFPPYDKENKWAIHAAKSKKKKNPVYHHYFKMEDLETDEVELVATKLGSFANRQKEVDFKKYLEELKGGPILRRSARLKKASSKSKTRKSR